MDAIYFRSSNEVRVARPNEQTMRAAVIENYGNSDVIQVRKDIAQPQNVGRHSVKVKVVASSVNPVDWKVRSGIFMLRWLFSGRFPKGLVISLLCIFELGKGSDLAGIIEKVGPKVTSFKVGDSVYGMTETFIPTYCEYAICKETSLAKKPKNMTFQEAATIPLAALTAWEALVDLAKIQKGYKVLVIGGSGGVGNFAVQICRAKEAVCHATCGTHNVDFVKSLGASKVIDYRTQDVVKELSGETFDIVFDTIGIKQQRDLLFPFVKTGGTLVTTLPCEGDSLTDCVLGFCDIVWKNVRYGILNRVKYIPVAVWPSQDALNRLRELVEAGQLKTFVDKEFTLENVKQAHDYSEQGRTRGKIAITVSQE